MSETIRAFVAIRVPPSPAVSEILGQFSAVGDEVRAVASDGLHVTLKFLGNTDTNWIGDVERVLHDVASQFTRFPVTLEGLGAFPNLRRPSVIWSGMTPHDPIIRLGTAVEQGLSAFGFSPDRLEFHPHVTLARIKSRPPKTLSAILDRHQSTRFATFTVNEIVLMQSELSLQGPRYTPVSVSQLQ